MNFRRYFSQIVLLSFSLSDFKLASIGVHVISDQINITKGAFSYIWHENAFLSYNQAEYALERLWEFTAGSAEWFDDSVIVFKPITENQVDAMLNLSEGMLPWIKLKNVLPSVYTKIDIDTDCLPALCATSTSAKLSYAGKGEYPLDLVAATFILLTRWEEWARPDLDNMGRHREDATLCARQNFRDRPVLDEWAMMLRPWLTKYKPSWQPVLPEPNIWISHDIDHMHYYNSFSRVARGFMRELIKQGSPKSAIKSIHDGIASLIDPSNDPCARAIDHLMDLDELLGASGTFFFMSAEPSKYDEGYDISAGFTKKVIERVRERGHEIAWHPGYLAAENNDVFALELARLRRSANLTSVGLRHHYLRWRAGRSWRCMVNNGISYDSSIAYSGCLGFRASTSHYYPAYDLEADVPLALEVRPLVIMDGPLLTNAFMAAKNIRKLMRRCFAVNGCFSILIHNYTLVIHRDIGDVVYGAMGEI